jgi:hypothetical protein
MFVNEKLQKHLSTSSSIKIESRVIAEWNMNEANNILQIGNYRYRPTDPTSPYHLPTSSFDTLDQARYYTDATFSDIKIDGGRDNEDQPIAFLSKQEKVAQLYSLEDCFQRNRPRSGINKARFFENKYTHFSNSQMSERPRYYVSSREDVFKYWSSFRQEDGQDRGIASLNLTDFPNRNYIEDACPYIVYKNYIPANRIILKMQTNVGDRNLGPFVEGGIEIQDPFYGEENKTTPKRWRVQYLLENTWIDAIVFDENSQRPDGTAIIGNDGYVELAYGPVIPYPYKDSFKLISQLTHPSLIPNVSELSEGEAYFVLTNTDSSGNFYMRYEGEIVSFPAQYGWQLIDENVNSSTPYVTELVDKKGYFNELLGQQVYREFQYIGGLRMVVETMNKKGATLDLIELSPRLAIDLSDKTVDFSIKKTSADLGVTGIPVSQLLASTGELTLFDYDQSFFSENTESLLYGHMTQNVQFKLYETVLNVEGENFVIPIKTMYSEGFPTTSSDSRSVNISLRDLFYYLESQTAPQILVPNASLSYVISLLLDSIGFSNYTFKRIDNEPDPEIPFFFVTPDTSVAEVISSLAMSTQSAIFFDEYNNLVVMSRDYVLPDEGNRDVDLVLYGSKDFNRNNEIKNESSQSALTSIIGISAQDKDVYNDGSINYTTRYIQKSFSSMKQAMVLDRDKTWTYKPVLLWEIAPSEQLKPINDEVATQSSYILSAIPINSDLSDSIPVVQNSRIINNIMDLGDGIYWISRYNGYFYANGEVIKYDAVQFNIPGLSDIDNRDPNVEGDNVWITSVREYTKYFSKIRFNGKMYPTGLVRIYAEPNYETINDVVFLQNGAVAKHGRGQFNTPVATHRAGLSTDWSGNDNVRGCKMDFKYLADESLELPETLLGPAGKNDSRALGTSRSGKIKNFFAAPTSNEINKNNSYPATVQASAFVFNGTSFATTDSPLEHISYVYKKLDNRFVHFGTRMRIIGRMENSEIRGQTPSGSFTYYTPTETTSDQPVAVAGSSGGIAFSLNPETNNGYYFEIIALTDSNVSDYEDSGVKNILFYKIKQNADDPDGAAIPVPIWSGVGDIIVDDGKFVGQSRLVAEENTTVYDLAVEYQDIGSFRRFYLYINNVPVAIVDDKDPLPIYNNLALFVRGSSQCMFENVYAISNNYALNTNFEVATLASNNDSNIFGTREIAANKSFQKYAMSGMIQSTYLSGLGPSQPPTHKIYFEEFGTIMREAAYFNIRYDKAFPALSAIISPTFNRVKGYTVSNFLPGAYGAEFMIFNATDTALSLDSTSGNYLRIQGITFTQESGNELTLDDYFDKVSSSSALVVAGENVITPPTKARKAYFNVKLSRMTHGVKSFSLDAQYIQSHDAAESLMAWLVNKIMKPNKSVGLKIFANPTIQLGDIIQIDYANNDGLREICNPEDRFVVYHIEYSRNNKGPTMQLYLSEVL